MSVRRELANDSPRIDCVVRTKNSARTVKACLESLQHSPLVAQIVLVDSGSTDDTLRIALTFPEVKIIRYPRGVDFNYSKALNIGIEVGTQALVATISSHVILTDGGLLARLVSSMSDPTCAGAYACPGVASEEVVMLKVFTGRNGMSNSCGIIRRLDWEERPFRESLAACEDQDYAAHWLRRGRYFVRLHDPSLLYLNPYSHPWKRIRDELVICQHIYPGLRNKRNFRRKFINLLGSLRRGRFRDAYWYSVGIVMLGCSAVFRINLKSCYRRELAG